MESRKENGCPYWFALILSLAFFGCTSKEVNQVYNGTYSTEKVRAMWHVCYITHKRTRPEAPEPFHWGICDCVVDEGRKKYGADEYNEHDQLEVTEFFRETVQNCSMELKGFNNDNSNIPRLQAL